MRVLSDWRLTPWRMAVHVESATAVVGDLHLGYDRVRRRHGEAVPLRRMRDELRPLADGMRQEKCRRLVIAGDLFESARVEREEMIDELLAWLAAQDIELIAVVPGNHDRGLGEEARLQIRKGAFSLGRWSIVHGDGERPAGPTVQGHEHPWLRWRPGVEGACYLVGEDHLILPAYSADAAGVDVRRDERWRAYRAAVIAGGRVLDFGPVGELP